MMFKSLLKDLILLGTLTRKDIEKIKKLEGSGEVYNRLKLAISNNSISAEEKRRIIKDLIDSGNEDKD